MQLLKVRVEDTLSYVPLGGSRAHDFHMMPEVKLVADEVAEVSLPNEGVECHGVQH